MTPAILRSPARPHVPSALRGVLLIMAAVLVFACMDAVTKHLAMRYNAPLVVAVRYIVNLLLLIAIMAPRHGMELVKTKRTGMMVFRAVLLALCSLCAGLALQRMPVAETLAIVYLAPFGVMLLAGPLLGERVGLAGWLAAGAGFAGVLLIIRPGAGLDGLGVVFASLTAFMTVGYYLLSRVLAATESTLAMLFYSAVAGTVLLGATLPWHWYGPAPGTLDVILFLSIGGLALLGHALFTAAYREAPASFLSPVNYMHLVWVGLLGWLVFGHVPDALSLLGIAVIALSGAAIAIKSHTSKSKLQEA
jgi:drug/metabolite transporter (DMT)-like permease